MKTPRQRVAIGVIGHGARASISLLASALLARWLEPSGYGTFVFVVGAATAIRQFFDFGTSTAFFTITAASPKPKSFYRAYWVWLGAQLLIATVLVGIALPASKFQEFFPTVSRSTAILAIVAIFIQGSFWSAACQGAEASRETARIHAISLVVALTYLVALLILNATGELNVEAVLAVIASAWGAACLAASYLHQYSPQDVNRRTGDFAEIFRLFAPHCRLMIPYALLGAASTFADRWMVQEWAGSQAQGEFGAALQLGSITILLTAATVPVLWKEAAEGHNAGHHDAARGNYARASNVMFIAAAVLAGLVMPWTPQIVQVSLGPSYGETGLLLALLVWYPVHQSVGQLQGTYLFATGRTAAYVKTGSVALVGGLALSYAMMAPRAASPSGLGLGSTGLAFKMLIVQFLTVSANDLLLFGMRRGATRILFQVTVAATCLAAGWLCASFSRNAFDAPTLQLLLSVLCYTVIVAGTGYVAARAHGLTSASPAQIVRDSLQRVRNLLTA
jgi:O-antigen/teichoic acid export membrane protein